MIYYPVYPAKLNFRPSEFFYRFTFPVKMSALMIYWWRIHTQKCYDKIKQGQHLGKYIFLLFSPVQLQSISVFVDSWPSSFQPKLLFFPSLPKLVPLNLLNSFSIDISSRKVFRLNEKKLNIKICLSVQIYTN